MPRWAVLLLVAIGLRALTFGNPIVHTDEEFYFVAAHGWLHGALPYVDIWDRKPVGLFLIYLPAAALGLPLGTWAYQAMALASVVATATLIGRLATRIGYDAGATLAGIAYLLWLNLATGESGQAPVFYNLLMVGAATLILPDRRNSEGRGIAAMALVGIALQIKYSAVFEGMFFGLWLMGAAWKRGNGPARVVGYGTLLVAVALLPTAIAWASFAAIGAGPEWIYANFTSILSRVADPLPERIGNLVQLVAILAPLVAMASLAGRSTYGETREQQIFIRWWLYAALAGIALFGGWFDHYALPAFVPATILAASFLGDSRRRRATVALLALAALLGQGLLIAHRMGRGTPNQLHALATAIGDGPGCLWVQSGSTMLYPATGRCAVTRYIFPSHLARTREAGAIGVDQAAEVHAIFARKPAVVVMRGPYRGERPEMRALALAELARAYRYDRSLRLGREQLRIFRRTAP